MEFLKSLTEARSKSMAITPGGFSHTFMQKLFSISVKKPDNKNSKKFPAKDGWKYAEIKPGIKVALPQGYYGKQQFIQGFYYTSSDIYFTIGTLRGAKKYAPGGSSSQEEDLATTGRRVTKKKLAKRIHTAPIRHGHKVTEETFQQAEITQYKVLNIF